MTQTAQLYVVSSGQLYAAMKRAAPAESLQLWLDVRSKHAIEKRTKIEHCACVHTILKDECDETEMGRDGCQNRFSVDAEGRILDGQKRIGCVVQIGTPEDLPQVEEVTS